jgi:pterin-4a-carbinolamine dehydratase
MKENAMTVSDGKHEAGAPLTAAEAGQLAPCVPLWTLSEKQIEREFKFKDFR